MDDTENPNKSSEPITECEIAKLASIFCKSKCPDYANDQCVGLLFVYDRRHHHQKLKVTLEEVFFCIKRHKEALDKPS